MLYQYLFSCLLSCRVRMNRLARKRINNLNFPSLLLSILLLTTYGVKGQDSRLYTTQMDSTASLGYDLNKNVIDMSNAKVLFAAGSSTGATAITLPFSIATLSHPLTQFLVSNAGFVMAAPPAPSVVTMSIANPQQLNTYIYNDNVMFAPFAEYYIGTDSLGVLYKVFGTFPNRVAVIEWNSLFPYQNATTPANPSKIKFQLRLYEGSSTIEYVYGQMKTGAWTTNVSSAIGLATNRASTNYSFIGFTRFDSLGITSDITKFSTTNVAINTGKLANLGKLNSTTEGHRTAIRFTPTLGNAPTNLKALNQTRAQATLYWDDNSSDETNFILYKSVNGGPYNILATLPPNINYFLDTLIVPSTSYSYRVQAILSNSCPFNAKILRFKTGKPDLNTALASGRWKNPKTWSAGHIPYSTDSVVIPSGKKVILDTIGFANNINLGGMLMYQDTLSASLALTLSSDLVISSTGRFTAAPGPQKTNVNHHLNIGRSIFNDDSLDLFTSNGSISSAVTVHFINLGNGSFTGSGKVNDVYQLDLTKFQNADTILLAPSVLTVKGTVTDAAAGAGFLLGNPANYKGTLRIGGTFTLDNRLRIYYSGSTDFVMPGSGLILDNPNFNITGTAGNAQVGINSTFIIRKGTWNVFQNTSGYYLYMKAGCTLQIEGGLVVINGIFYENEAGTYIQRGGKVVMNSALNFLLASATSEMSGGTMILTGKFSTNAVQNSILVAKPTFTNFQIGSALTPGLSNFNAGFYGNYPSLVIDSTINTSRSINLYLTSTTNVYGKIYVQDNDLITLNANSYLYFYGDSMILKNKLSASLLPSTIGFYGAKRQVVSGNTHGSYWNAIDINNSFSKDSALVLNIPDSIITVKLMMKRGNIANAKRLTIGDAVNNVDVQIGGTIFKAGKLDSQPHAYLGNTLYTLEYLSDPQTRVSGFEVPVRRNIYNLNMNNPLGRVILNKGPLRVSGTLTLTAGIIHADTSNVLILTDSLSTSGITGGSATSYIQGVLERFVSPLLTGVKNYPFPVGDSLMYRPLNLIAPVTGNNGKVDIYVQLADSSIKGIGSGKLYTIDSTFYWKVQFRKKMSNLLSGKFQVPFTNTYVRLRIGKSSTTAARPVKNMTFTEIGKKIDDNNLQSDDISTAFDTTKPVNFLALSYYKLDTLKPGTYFVGKGRDFVNLTAVSEILNSSIIKDRVTFRMTKDYDPTTEVFPISFDQIIYKDNTPHKITIGLAPDVYNVTTTNIAALAAGVPLIRFNSADSLDFDGQGYDILGRPTGTREWTFATATNSASSPVFLYVKDAMYNILENLKLTGGLTATTYGIVQLDAGTKTGNSYNIIRNNLFSSPAAGPFVPLYLNSAPIATPIPIPNQFNEIRGNEFVNFSYKAIQAGNYSNGWTIAGNHIYQTSTTIAYTGGMAAIDYQPLYGTDASLIDGNYIGGTAPFAASTVWNSPSTTPMTFINARTNNVGKCIIKNNVIKNLNLTSTSTGVYIYGIQLLDGNITVANNKIGGPNTTDKITSYAQGANRFIFIVSGNGQKIVTNNEISNIELMTTGSSTTFFYGIVSNAGTPTQPAITISNNYIHDIKGTGTWNSWSTSAMNGIYIGANQLHNITGNIIANLTQKDVGANLGIAAYQVTTTNIGTNIIDGNIVYGLYRTSATASSTIGIFGNIGTFQFSNNVVYLTNAGNETKPTDISGIFVPGYSGFTRKVFNNTIYIGGSTTSLTTAGNSYAFNYQSTSADSVWNNIFINTRSRTTTGTDLHYAAYFPSIAYATSNQLDFNYYYAATAANAIYMGANYTFATFKGLTGKDKNSFTGNLPKFVNLSAGDFHMKNDTANAYFKATGKGTLSAPFDMENDSRNKLQPDMGADEFTYTGMPQAPVLVSKPDTVCPGDTIVLKAFNASSGSGKLEWFNQSAGGDTLATGATFRPVINATTTYYVQVRNNKIHSYRTAFPVIVRTVPAIIVSNAPVTKLCKGSSVNLLASGWKGASYYWYSVPKGGSSLATGSSFASGSIKKDTIFYVEARGPMGCKTIRKAINISIDTGNILAAPVLKTIAPVCFGQKAVLGATSKAGVRWYLNMNSATPLVQDTTYTTGVLNRDTTYYVDAYNGSCNSVRIPVAIHVVPLPKAPAIAVDNYVCKGNSIMLASKDSVVIKWYASDTASNAILVGKQFSIASVNKDSTIYAAAFNGNCESGRMSIHVYKRALPDTPDITMPAPICYGEQAMLQASLPTYKISWYASAGSNIALKQDSQFMTGPLTHDSTFYVEANDGNCGTRVPVKVTVYQKATKPVIVKTDSVCYGGVGYISASSNGHVRWFSAMNSGTVLDTGVMFKVTGITSDTTFYAENMTNTGCISERIAAPVKIRTRPNPPVLVPLSPICQGDKTTLIAVTKDSAKWYSSSTATTPLSMKDTFYTPILQSNTTYYLAASNGVCSSSRIPVAVTVRNHPTEPGFSKDFRACSNNVVRLNTDNNQIAKWYLTATSKQAISTDSMFYTGVLSHDTAFYAEAYDGYCGSSVRVKVPVTVIQYTKGLRLVADTMVKPNQTDVVSVQGDAANSYSWDFGPDANVTSASGVGPFNIRWTTPGSKPVTVYIHRKSGTTTCDTTIIKTVTVINTSGIAPQGNSTMLEVYPNPATDILHVKVKLDKQQKTIIKLNSVDGKVLMQELLPATATVEKTYDVSGLAKGLYIISIETKESVIRKQIIVQ